MSAIASPWDALLRARPMRMSTADDSRRWPPMADAEEPAEPKPATKLSILLAELAEVRSATTASLCVRAELDSRQVWGLLKAPRDAGQVWFIDGRWSLNPYYRGRDIERAAKLLRDAGWMVREPG